MPVENDPSTGRMGASAQTPHGGVMDQNGSCKNALRKRRLSERHHISDDRLSKAGRNLAVQLLESVLPLVASKEDDRMDASDHGREGSVLGHIPRAAAFSSIQGEVPTDDLLKTLLDCGYQVLIPKLGTGLEVGWGLMSGLTDLGRMEIIGGWRPDEPEGVSLPAESLAGARLILVPALSIDTLGTRLGRGGGWYDRALVNRTDGALVVGICWEEELVTDPLPHLPHDLPVDAVLTPTGFTLTAAGRSRRASFGS